MASAVSRDTSSGREQQRGGISASTTQSASTANETAAGNDAGRPRGGSTVAACSSSLLLRSSQDAAAAIDPPPPYSTASPCEGNQDRGLFMPYVTQELPRYSEFGTPISQRQIGEIQLGFMRQSGGQYVPIQIPGYIATGPNPHDPRHQLSDSSRQLNAAPPTLSPRNNDRRNRGMHHSPVLARRRNSEVAISSRKDYFKLTFAMLIICTLFLNLPAVLMLMGALYFSVKVKDSRASHRYAKCKKYSSYVLVCHYFVLLEFFVIVLCGFALILVMFVFNISLS